MNTRLNGILTTLSHQYAYHLIQNAPNDDTRLKYLADGLANTGFLVILAEIPANNFDVLLKTWLDGYHRLYNVLSGTLFPMFKSVNIGTGDQMRPPVMVIQGESAAVIQVLAGYVVPYIALRQKTQSISDAEIIGLMTYILDELEANELPRRQYDQLLRQCAAIIRQLITLPIQQYSLTALKKPLFQQTHLQPRDLPKKMARPIPPKILPETGSLNPDVLNRVHPDQREKADQNKTQPMPIWFNIDDDLDKTKPQPPVPWNPDDDSK